MNKIIKLHIFTLLALTALNNAVFGMEEGKSTIPPYRTFEGKEITAKTIGALALQHCFSGKEKEDVLEFRNQYKELITELLDFSDKNSEHRAVNKKCIEKIKAAGLHYNGYGSHVFPFPNNSDIFFQASGPFFKAATLVAKKDPALYCKIWTKEGLTPEEWDSAPKGPTSQTGSRFTNGLRFLEIAREHNFQYISVPSIALFALNDEQPIDEWNDGNSFAAQMCMPQGCVPVSANTHRLNHVHHEALKELLIAIDKIGIWDLSSLYITPNNKFVITNLQKGSDDTSESIDSDPHMFNHRRACGLKALYGFCANKPELQKIVQKFVRNNVHFLDNPRKQEIINDVFTTLEIKSVESK